MTAGPYMGPTPGDELARNAAEAAARMEHAEAIRRAEHTQYYRNVSDSAVPTTDSQVAISNIGRHSTRNSIAAAAIFLAGFYVLPPGRARNMYLLSWGLAIGGLFTSDWSGELTGWWIFTGYPTVWTWLLWTAALFCFIELWRAVAAHKRAIRAQVAQAAPQPAAAASTPLAPLAPDSAPAPVQEPSPTSKLIIPSYTTRRVRRAGTTLSGVPFNDRRAVDPRTLRPRKHN